MRSQLPRLVLFCKKAKHPQFLYLRLSIAFIIAMRYTLFFPSCLLPLASCLLPLASCLLPLDSCLLPLASCLLPLASCLLPLASCLLPLASCLLPAPCLLFPKTNQFVPHEFDICISVIILYFIDNQILLLLESRMGQEFLTRIPLFSKVRLGRKPEYS